jgi:hypothetical protein
MIGTLNHIYVVDLIWQAHLERRDHGFKVRNVLRGAAGMAAGDLDFRYSIF